ncbi:ABC-2 type transport system permease protein [Parageobacillus thermantarcticus]|uniref:ABC-2 type transport system permease protein n=1 Tax=Parageobacillus thermantarcticus TaxID=186116 RepID=A0A1I0TDM9_9BACL|nr:ABC-2 family transporter protein [Parageobacillus thermantarcticus]SFA49673.1 ABC-2 type transport system permease protein [Parageobacillus thermantarcticus]
MRRYVRIFREFFRACFVEELEYRSEFLGNLISSFFGIGIAVLTVNIFFYQTDQLGGWTYADVLVLLGVFNTLRGMIDFALRPNMPRLLEHVRRGTLDYILTKPVDSMFYVSFRHLVFWRLIDVLLGIGVIGYGLIKKHYIPSLVDVIVFIVTIAASFVLIYSLWMLLMTTSFWVIRIDDLSFIFDSFFETARFPVGMYRGWVRIVLTYVLPAAVITNMPALSLLGKWNMATALIAALLALVFLWLARRFWRFALRFYTSASS